MRRISESGASGFLPGVFGNGCSFLAHERGATQGGESLHNAVRPGHTSVGDVRTVGADGVGDRAQPGVPDGELGLIKDVHAYGTLPASNAQQQLAVIRGSALGPGDGAEVLIGRFAGIGVPDHRHGLGEDDDAVRGKQVVWLQWFVGIGIGGRG